MTPAGHLYAVALDRALDRSVALEERVAADGLMRELADEMRRPAERPTSPKVAVGQRALRGLVCEAIAQRAGGEIVH